MMGRKDYSERSQMEIASLEDLVPKKHLVRKIEDAMDFSFIYDEVKDLYSDFGRESIDPVVLIKIAMLHCWRRSKKTGLHMVRTIKRERTNKRRGKKKSQQNGPGQRLVSQRRA